LGRGCGKLTIAGKSVNIKAKVGPLASAATPNPLWVRSSGTTDSTRLIAGRTG
jgi:hypothetical protein